MICMINVNLPGYKKHRRFWQIYGQDVEKCRIFTTAGWMINVGAALAAAQNLPETGRNRPAVLRFDTLWATARVAPARGKVRWRP